MVGRIRELDSPQAFTLYVFSRDEPSHPISEAARLAFRRMTALEPAARAYAAKQLTAICNAEWSDGDIVTEQQFAARLIPESIEVHEQGYAEFHFKDDGLFAGHGVGVRVKADGAFKNAEKGLGAAHEYSFKTSEEFDAALMKDLDKAASEGTKLDSPADRPYSEYQLPKNYNMFTHNCTTFCTEAMRKAEKKTKQSVLPPDLPAKSPDALNEALNSLKTCKPPECQSGASFEIWN